MSSSYTIQLPPGTNVTKLINIPTAGSWLGAVNVSWVTHTTSMTVHEAIFINENPPRGISYKGYRHVDYAGNQGAIDNWTLPKETRCWKVLFKGESMFKLRYTASNEVSVCIETTQTAWNSNNYPGRTFQHPNTLVLPNKYDGVIIWTPK